MPAQGRGAIFTHRTGQLTITDGELAILTVPSDFTKDKLVDIIKQIKQTKAIGESVDVFVEEAKKVLPR